MCERGGDACMHKVQEANAPRPREIKSGGAAGGGQLERRARLESSASNAHMCDEHSSGRLLDACVLLSSVAMNLPMNLHRLEMQCVCESWLPVIMPHLELRGLKEHAPLGI